MFAPPLFIFISADSNSSYIWQYLLVCLSVVRLGIVRIFPLQDGVCGADQFRQLGVGKNAVVGLNLQAHPQNNRRGGLQGDWRIKTKSPLSLKENKNTGYNDEMCGKFSSRGYAICWKVFWIKFRRSPSLSALLFSSSCWPPGR